MDNPYAAPVGDLTAAPACASQITALAINGRIGRMRFVAYVTGSFLLFVLVFGLLLRPLLNDPASALGGVLSVLFSLLFWAVFLVYSRRRLQDVGRGRLTFLCLFIPIAQVYFGFMMLFQAGDEGDNAFGAHPPANTVGVKVLAFFWPVLLIAGIGIAVVTAGRT
jgi:uncharacterized membrane protein YhaH (DUF805 family)